MIQVNQFGHENFKRRQLHKGNVIHDEEVN
jgi:hypothetical protein